MTDDFLGAMRKGLFSSDNIGQIRQSVCYDMKEVKNKSKHASKTFLQKITDTDDKKNTEVSVFQYVFEIRSIIASI